MASSVDYLSVTMQLSSMLDDKPLLSTDPVVKSGHLQMNNSLQSSLLLAIRCALKSDKQFESIIKEDCQMLCREK